MTDLGGDPAARAAYQSSPRGQACAVCWAAFCSAT